MTQRYQVHRCAPEQLEQLMNDHAERDWRVFFIRAVGNYGKSHQIVTFVRDFENHAEANDYMDEREERRKVRAAQAAKAAQSATV